MFTNFFNIDQNNASNYYFFTFVIFLRFNTYFSGRNKSFSWSKLISVASFIGFPTETHELNPFGNPNDYVQNGSQGGMATTQFTGDYDAGYQQGGGNFPQR